MPSLGDSGVNYNLGSAAAYADFSAAGKWVSFYNMSNSVQANLCPDNVHPDTAGNTRIGFDLFGVVGTMLSTPTPTPMPTATPTPGPGSYLDWRHILDGRRRR